MKRLLVLALGLMVIGLAFSPAYADSNTSGAAHVLVNVNPIIAITPVPQASIPTVQLGKFIVPISWLIGANAQQVALTLEASPSSRLMIPRPRVSFPWIRPRLWPSSSPMETPSMGRLTHWEH